MYKNEIHNPFLEFSLSRNTWIHLALTLSKKTTSIKINLYVNCKLKGTSAGSFSEDMTYMKNGHVVYDVGLKRESGITFKGHLKDLAVFGKVLTQNMISDVYRGFATCSTIEARGICRCVVLFC